jgi:hypothetical protein
MKGKAWKFHYFEEPDLHGEYSGIARTNCGRSEITHANLNWQCPVFELHAS